MARPKKTDGEIKDQRVPIVMSPSELKAIDDWMHDNRIRSRGEAIRRLCQIGMLIASKEDVLVGPAIEAIELAERFWHFSSKPGADAARLAQLGEALSAATTLLAIGTVPAGLKAHAFATGASVEAAVEDIENNIPPFLHRQSEVDELRKIVDDEVARPLGWPDRKKDK